MTYDVLSILITRIVLKSIFSVSGWLIDKYSSNLGMDRVQVLMCGKDWLRAYYDIKGEKRASVNFILVDNFILVIIINSCILFIGKGCCRASFPIELLVDWKLKIEHICVHVQVALNMFIIIFKNFIYFIIYPYICDKNIYVCLNNVFVFVLKIYIYICYIFYYINIGLIGFN